MNTLQKNILRFLVFFFWMLLTSLDVQNNSHPFATNNYQHPEIIAIHSLTDISKHVGSMHKSCWWISEDCRTFFEFLTWLAKVSVACKHLPIIIIILLYTWLSIYQGWMNAWINCMKYGNCTDFVVIVNADIFLVIGVCQQDPQNHGNFHLHLFVSCI